MMKMVDTKSWPIRVAFSGIAIIFSATNIYQATLGRTISNKNDFDPSILPPRPECTKDTSKHDSIPGIPLQDIMKTLNEVSMPIELQAQVLNKLLNREKENTDVDHSRENKSNVVKKIAKAAPVVDAKVKESSKASTIVDTKVKEKVRQIEKKILTDKQKSQSKQEKKSQGSSGENEGKVSKPLNVVVLYPDDMRHDSLSVAGNPIVETPFLDQLAGEGMRFTHNCVTTSICWVSRATWLTGQHQAKHKSSKLRNPPFYEKWNETFPALLQKAGYYTGHFGKWQFSDYDFVKARYNETEFVEGMHWVQSRKNGTKVNTHITDHNRDSAHRFLRNRPKDTPFFLGVAFYAPKALGQGDKQYNPKPETLARYLNKTVPQPPDTFNNTPWFFQNNTRFEARERYRQRYGTPELYQRMMKEYYSMITEVDSACRDIYNELEKQGELDNTMIIFTTDNGYFHAEHGLAGKWFPYQESIRVPLIIRDPRMPASKRGEIDDSFTLNIDLAETILGAANIEPPSSMQGRDIADIYLRNASDWRDEFFYDFAGQGRKIIPRSLAVVRKDIKLMKFPEWGNVAMFNLTEDPLEEKDLSRDPRYEKLVKTMLKKLVELEKEARR